MKIRRIAPLLLLSSLSSVAVGCGPEVPAGLGTSTPGSASQSKPPTLDDAGVATSPGSGSSGSTPSAGVDSAAVIASVAQNNYQTSPSFTEVTRSPYPSVAMPGSMVREWVSTSSLAAYEAISPEVVGSGNTVPVGTTIVRAVLDEDGGVGELTLMFKGPPGYNSALGDWWFGVTDSNGAPDDADGGPEYGKLEACFSCHVPRSDDGYLFGVPLDDRASGGQSDDAGGGGTGVDAGAPAVDSGDDSGDDDAGKDSGGGHHHHVVGEDEALGGN